MKAVLLLLLAFTLAATPEFVLADLPTGRPPIRQFSPDLDVYPQNFAIAVDGRGRVYVGNAEGVLIFDGAFWHQVALPNHDIVRSLKAAPDGRIYVGGYDAFGYLEVDATGAYVYRDLAHLFSAQMQGAPFADIWHIEVTDDAVWFVALEDLFRWSPATGAVEYLRHEGSFGPIVEFDGRVLLQFRGEGLREYRDGRWLPLAGPDFSHSLLAAMVPVAPDRLIIVSTDRDWYRFDGTRFAAIPAAADIPWRGSVTDALYVGDDTLALTTQLGKVVFHHLDTDRSEVVNLSSGFLSGAVRSGTGQLLFVDDLGFHAVTWPAPWRLVTDGLAGTIYSVDVVDGDTYALGSSGAFVSRRGAQHFERLPWTDYEAWDLLPVEDGAILLADSYQIRRIPRRGPIEIIDPSTTARLLVRSRFDPDRIYVGTELGLQVLEHGAAGWGSVYRNDDMDNLRVNGIVETAPGELWLGADRGGLRRIRLDHTAGWSMTETRLGPAEGLVYGDDSTEAHVQVIDGVPRVSTARGLFRWQGERFEPDTADGLSALVPAGQIVQFGDTGRPRWAFTHGHLYHRDQAWHEEALGGLRRGAIQVVGLAERRIVVGILGGLLTYDPDIAPPTRAGASLELSSATVVRTLPGTGDHRDDRSTRLPLDRIAISSADSRLTLRYVLADLASPGQVRYRTRLEPAEASFSPWSQDAQQSFVTLPPGRFRLLIEARDSLDRVSRLELPIDVEPQWFETSTFRAAIAVILLLALYLLSSVSGRRRARLLTIENERLEDMVNARTRDLKSANEQLEALAHLDGLTQLPNRRRLDAYLDEVWRQSLERGREMAVALIDVDHFKRFNDTHGHQAGDELLIALAGLLGRHLRRNEDLVARYGGEEFLLVLPGADRETGREVAEAMRAAVAASSLGITVSAGVHACRPAAGASVADLIAAADAALYAAKRGGRDRVVHEPPESAG